MKGKFIRNFEVGARAITPDACLAPSDMFDLLQETATVHSDELGYDFDYFRREKKGWTILTWHAELERLPRWREKVTVETWPTAGRGIVTCRNFRVLDEAENAIMRVVSRWVYFDLIRRRPVKISEEMREAYSSGIDDIITPDRLIIESPPESAKIGGYSLTAKRSHTDSNFHVNNVSYVRWAEDALPDSVFERRLKTMRVNYRKEAKTGDKMNITAYRVSENTYVCVIISNSPTPHTEILWEYEGD